MPFYPGSSLPKKTPPRRGRGGGGKQAIKLFFAAETQQTSGAQTGQNHGGGFRNG